MGGGGNQVQETPAQRALADHARNLMQDYRQRWMPLQQNLAKQATAMGAEGSAQRRQAAGMAAGSVEQQFGQAEPKLETRLAATGAAPGSSKSTLALSGMNLDKAAAKGMGTTISDQRIDDAYTQTLGALMAMGRGERAQVGTNMANIAGLSGAQAANDAALSLANKSGRAELGATAVGMGMQQYLKPQGLNTSGEQPAGINGGAYLPSSLRGANNYGG